jgi:hypothetical protein
MKRVILNFQKKNINKKHTHIESRVPTHFAHLIVVNKEEILAKCKKKHFAPLVVTGNKKELNKKSKKTLRSKLMLFPLLIFNLTELNEKIKKNKKIKTVRSNLILLTWRLSKKSWVMLWVFSMYMVISCMSEPPLGKL